MCRVGAESRTCQSKLGMAAVGQSRLPQPARRDAVSLWRGRLEAGNVGSHDYHAPRQTGTTPLPALDSCASKKKRQLKAIVNLFPIPPIPHPVTQPPPCASLQRRDNTFLATAATP